VIVTLSSDVVDRAERHITAIRFELACHRSPFAA